MFGHAYISLSPSHKGSRVCVFCAAGACHAPVKAVEPEAVEAELRLLSLEGLPKVAGKPQKSLFLFQLIVQLPSVTHPSPLFSAVSAWSWRCGMPTCPSARVSRVVATIRHPMCSRLRLVSGGSRRRAPRRGSHLVLPPRREAAVWLLEWHLHGLPPPPSALASAMPPSSMAAGPFVRAQMAAKSSSFTDWLLHWA